MYGDFPRDFPTISTTYLKVQAGYTGVGIWHVLQQNNHYCTQYYSNSTLTSCAMASEWTDARQSSSDDTKTVSLWEKCRLGWLLDHITCTHLFNFFACVIGSPLSPYSNNTTYISHCTVSIIIHSHQAVRWVLKSSWRAQWNLKWAQPDYASHWHTVSEENSVQ